MSSQSHTDSPGSLSIMSNRKHPGKTSTSGFGKLTRSLSQSGMDSVKSLRRSLSNASQRAVQATSSALGPDRAVDRNPQQLEFANEQLPLKGFTPRPVLTGGNVDLRYHQIGQILLSGFPISESFAALCQSKHEQFVDGLSGQPRRFATFGGPVSFVRRIGDHCCYCDTVSLRGDGAEYNVLATAGHLINAKCLNCEVCIHKVGESQPGYPEVACDCRPVLAYTKPCRLRGKLVKAKPFALEFVCCQCQFASDAKQRSCQRCMHNLCNSCGIPDQRFDFAAAVDSNNEGTSRLRKDYQ